MTAVSVTISHCVAIGSGMPRLFSRPCSLYHGTPLPYRSRAIMLAAVSSYFFSPTPSGAAAVNTSPHRLHRNFSNSYTVAAMGACPLIRTSTPGSRCGYTLPRHRASGHGLPAFNDACGTATLRAPRYATAPLRPCPAVTRWEACETPGGLLSPLSMPAFLSTLLVFSVLE